MVYATGAAGVEAPTLVIAQGRFQVANVEAAFRERWSGATTDRWRGVPLLAEWRKCPGLGLAADLRLRAARAGAGRHRPGVRRRDRLSRGGRRHRSGVVRRDLLGLTGTPAPAVLVLMTVDERVRMRVGDVFPLPRTLRSVGVRLDAGESLRLVALGVLDDRESAAELARRLGALLSDRETRRALGAFGLGELLDGARVTADGARVRLSLSVGRDQRAPIAAALRAIAKAVRTGVDPQAGGSW